MALHPCPRGLVGLAAGLWLLAPSPAGAELYSWVDEQGGLHFTDVKDDARWKPYALDVDVGGAKPVAFESYQAEDAGGFGGEQPLVLRFSDGAARTLYRVDVGTYDPLLREAADHYRLPFAFLKAIAKVESNFNPRAVSRAQAKGLMQLIDDTANLLSVDDPFDARQSAFGGARYLRMLANMFGGDMALTAAAYNAGPERVRRAKGVPPIQETTAYVRRVLEMYRYYRRAE